MIRFFLRWILTFFLLTGVGIVAITAYSFLKFSQATVDFTNPKTINIKPGEGMKKIARGLEEQGLHGESWQWIVLSKLKGVDRKIKAGDYLLSGRMTTTEVLDKMVQGDVLLQSVRIPEGLPIWEIKKLLAKSTPLTITALPSIDNDELVQALKLSSASPEGLFFPDTYHVLKGTTDMALLGSAAQKMQDELNKAWSIREADLPLSTPYEALILASIVEKETGKADDRGLVASVFINRLHMKMPLQSDPTTIYGIGESFNGNLTRADLQRPSAYNTYTIPSLPPTPIASVSLASINAVLHPPKNDYLYFVARGDGSSEFSRTLSEHNAAVNRYQKKMGAK